MGEGAGVVGVGIGIGGGGGGGSRRRSTTLRGVVLRGGERTGKEQGTVYCNPLPLSGGRESHKAPVQMQS